MPPIRYRGSTHDRPNEVYDDEKTRNDDGVRPGSAPTEVRPSKRYVRSGHDGIFSAGTAMRDAMS